MRKTVSRTRTDQAQTEATQADGTQSGATGSTRGDASLPTEAELEILRVLWELGLATVREVHGALRGRATGYTTVLKQMQVMTEKGLLTRSERFRSHVYQPTAAKARTQQRLTSDLLRRAFDGSAAQLVLGALSAKAVSGEELKEIRATLDRFESEGLKGLDERPHTGLKERAARRGDPPEDGTRRHHGHGETDRPAPRGRKTR